MPPTRNWLKGRNFHLMGIGGSGMSALGRVLAEYGARVSGCDLAPGDTLKELPVRGIPVEQGHHPGHLSGGIDRLVASTAIAPDHPEIVAARVQGLSVRSYPDQLAEIASERKLIAVSGCHGKTTTTAMIAFTMTHLGMDPGFVVGGSLRDLATNGSGGAGDWFVVEACEFGRSFHRFRPDIAIINNIEEDHLDYYADLGEILEAFREFRRLVRPEGLLLLGFEDERARSLCDSSEVEVQGFGLGSGFPAWRAADLSADGGLWSYTVRYWGETLCRVRLKIPGKHNVLNSLGAFAAAFHAGAEPGRIAESLSEFTGVARRMEFVGEHEGIAVLDDYAHHPTEITATVRSIRQCYPGRTLWLVFQPHQYSRTRIFLDRFAESLGEADEVVVPEIFSARDRAEDRRRVSSRDLCRLLEGNGQKARYTPTLEEAVDFLLVHAKPPGVVVTMGAGDVGRVAREFLRRISEGPASPVSH